MKNFLASLFEPKLLIAYAICMFAVYAVVQTGYNLSQPRYEVHQNIKLGVLDTPIDTIFYSHKTIDSLCDLRYNEQTLLDQIEKHYDTIQRRMVFYRVRYRKKQDYVLTTWVKDRYSEKIEYEDVFRRVRTGRIGVVHIKKVFNNTVDACDEKQKAKEWIVWREKENIAEIERERQEVIQAEIRRERQEQIKDSLNLLLECD